MGHRRRHDVFVTGNWAFLPHPCGERGHWTRTDRCVAFVACPYCHSEVGELCTNDKGHGKASTHVRRRDAYQARRTVQIGPGTPLPAFGSSAYPVAFGKTPALACEAFDHVWHFGWEEHDCLPDKRCGVCGSRVYHVEDTGLIKCEYGHTSEVF